MNTQVLSIYLQHILRRHKDHITLKIKTKTLATESRLDSSDRPIPASTSNSIQMRKRAIDLGAGTGLLSLAMRNLGYDVLSTDIGFISEGILRQNIERNSTLGQRETPAGEGREAGVRASCLDWTVDSEDWDWGIGNDVTPSSSSLTTPSSPPVVGNGIVVESKDNVDFETNRFSPPFSLILTTDSIYHPSLIQPLLDTLRSLSILSTYSPHVANRTSFPRQPPEIYLALENRDPALIDSFWEEATTMGFKSSRVESGVLKKVMERAYEKGGEEGKWELGWRRDEWEGVEIWKMSYKEAK